MRQAFAMQLKPSALPEYRRRHDAAWPDLLQAIGSRGVRSFTIYHADGERLFVHSELDDAGAWERAWGTPVHRRWGATIAPLLAVDERGAPLTASLDEVFHYARRTA
ncbi:MAG: L-rhamnose mutarotase [Solirubrobacteraceae bacterium]